MSKNIVRWPKVIIFGDSLTQRSFEAKNGLWGTLLADRLQRICDVVPRGFSGYNSRMCKLILPRLYDKNNIQDIEVFVICLGANDACHEPSPQHVSLLEYSTNIKDIINYLQSIGLKKEKIVLMTPPPYHSQSYKRFCQEVGRNVTAKDNKTVKMYATACCEVAQELNVSILDVYTEFMKDQNWPRYLIDGLHFSHSGSVLVYTLLWPYIAKRTDNLKMNFPIWSDINPECPEKDLL